MHVITCGECPMQLASRPGWTLTHVDDGSHVAKPPTIDAVRANARFFGGRHSNPRLRL